MVAICFGRFRDGCDLRYADSRDDPCGADRTGANADFDSVGARVHQVSAAVGSGDIASDDIDFPSFLDRANRLNNVQLNARGHCQPPDTSTSCRIRLSARS